MRRFRTLGLLATLLCWLPGPAFALGIVPNPVTFSGDGILGEIELLEIVAGTPASGIVLEGSVGAGDQTLVLRGRLDPASGIPLAFAVGVATPGAGGPDVALNGIGWVPGPDADILAAGTLDGTEAAFGGGFLPGGVSDRFFVAYPAGSITPGLRLFAGATANLGAPIVAQSEALFVPEPSALLLLAAGLLGTGAASRARPGFRAPA